MQAWIDLTTSSFQFGRTDKNSDHQRKMARIMCIRETDAERSNGREGEGDFGCEISIDPRNAAIIRGRGGALPTHTFVISTILAFAPGVLFTRVDEARELRSRGLPLVVIATTGQDPG